MTFYLCFYGYFSVLIHIYFSSSSLTVFRFLESAVEQLDSLVAALEEDTFNRNISDVDIDLVEQELTRKSANPGVRRVSR